MSTRRASGFLVTEKVINQTIFNQILFPKLVSVQRIRNIDKSIYEKPINPTLLSCLVQVETLTMRPRH